MTSNVDDMFDFLQPETQSKDEIKEEEEINEYIMKRRKIIEDKYKDLLPRPESTPILEAQYQGCTHEVAIPDGQTATEQTLNPQYPREPAKTYPFTLDDFQRLSISCIGQNESVLVSAHTSAGKTAVAEYAIASALKNNQRVIYTSPIKALSNQKYRDLQEQFTDVGLITGDITINEEASCLVMTTEILRNMLYRGNDVMREVAWVIFDEVHYMRDKERGVVWEESIILLPDTVHYVFLSATIPNAFEFASWISNIHKQVCHVVYTDYRPTPLCHYLFPAGGNGIYLVVDKECKFREEGFNKALTTLGLDAVGIKTTRKQMNNKPDVIKIITMIMKNNLAPVIIFSFNRKELEIMAKTCNRMDLTSDDEKTIIGKIFNNAIQCLNAEDRKLEQITELLPLLLKGVGMHHSGLLPIMKETVEILFQEGLIKCLFATETFAMGLNMPARTVVFTKVKKYDGKETRYLRPGEYIQMSGRAGRRGKDEQGTVILMVDQKIEPTVLKNMIFGKADPLTSSFYLGYNMVLNLMKLEAADPEGLICKSFRQFQTNNKLPELQKKLKELEEKEKTYIFTEENIIKPIYHLKLAIEQHKENIHENIYQEKVILPFLVDGRLVHIIDKNTLFDFGWVPIIADKKRKVGSISVIVSLKKGALERTPEELGKGGKAGITTFNIECISEISTLRLGLPDNVKDNLDTFLFKINNAIKKKYPDFKLPVLDPINDMKIKEENIIKSIKKVKELEERWKEIEWNDNIKKEFDKFVERENIREEINVLRNTVIQSKDVILKDELRGMRRVLKRLGYVSEDDIIQTKGRVAAELSAGNEILLTELLFSGVFSSLNSKQATALLGCFVLDEKPKESIQPPKDLEESFALIITNARRIGNIMADCRLNINVDKYIEQFRPTMLPIVESWCDGMTFAQLIHGSELFEGSIIRGMRRLEELLVQMTDASKFMGNPDLAKKFEEGITLIKRDIIFAASLYI
ncbi:helicase, putative [Entamoeba dispar SAW760]|uniref:Helicase, putative n=1 Tax=Entamoeba dispar (strain ATCC PRA-260 / SAW760) TaxID=370354 RepID=B0E7S8_ENTDS|nr:helicase, putative [Entamoeba dispar SAW760]EDR29400.1 helicase, putative [Entamoeba dispar SAW760]|eukprot:EDR29400.1 helicase, putative [Entamoeba dispar SAW760]